MNKRQLKKASKRTGFTLTSKRLGAKVYRTWANKRKKANS